MSNLRIEHDELSLRRVIEDYASEFKPTDKGIELDDIPTWIIDPFKRVVLFKLWSRNVGGGNPKKIMQEIKMDAVVYAFAKKLFKVSDVGMFPDQGEWSTGEKIVQIEWFVDPILDKVVYRVFVESIEVKS